MRKLATIVLFFAAAVAASAAWAQEPSGWITDLPQPHNYVQKRSSSYDRSGGNDDYRPLAAGATLELLDAAGPSEISHIWITIASGELYHLKKIVLRMYWDGEAMPSVEAPVGDFFGLGLGDYFLYQSIPLAVGGNKALNSFFPMPFQKHARITLTNEGSEEAAAIYWNIDYREYSAPLPADTLYFHAQYRQATPSRAIPDNKINLDGKDNYVWMEAKGRGHFAGVTMSVIENADGWWGEGDDMFFVDGEKLPSINGTGTEDYFLGAWDFGGKQFAYGLFGAPVVGMERQGERWSVYRFHLDSPIPFTKSLRATIEHGHANDRGDNYYSVAYWYQTEPHSAFPPLPPVEERLPRVIPRTGSH
ncbi:MAG TPA: glycoside hydrolase family 172 protein [Candidatus Limnocylindrales bacterium]|nr:glycoside hydrolase family 172 protein [Candidatus Limnocylindrales bacterium]